MLGLIKVRFPNCKDKEYKRLFLPVKVKDEISSLSSRGFDSDL
jgi:hypothetical protein